MELSRPTCLRDLTEEQFLAYLARVTASEGFERRQVQKTPLLKLVALQSCFLPQTIDDCTADLNAPRAHTRLLFPLPHQDTGPKKALVRSDYPILLQQLTQIKPGGDGPVEVWLVGHEGTGNTIFSYYLLNAVFDFATEDFGLLLGSASPNGLWHVTRRKVSYVPLHENECPRTVWSDERHRHHGDLSIAQSWMVVDGTEASFPDNIESALRIRLVKESDVSREGAGVQIIRIPNWSSMDVLLSLFWCHRHFLKDMKELEERIDTAGPIPGLLFASDMKSVREYLKDKTIRAVNGEAVNLYQLFLRIEHEQRLPISNLVARTLMAELEVSTTIEHLWTELCKKRGKGSARNSTQLTAAWSDTSAEQTEPETDPTSATRLPDKVPQRSSISKEADEETTRHRRSRSQIARMSNDAAAPTNESLEQVQDATEKSALNGAEVEARDEETGEAVCQGETETGEAETMGVQTREAEISDVQTSTQETNIKDVESEMRDDDEEEVCVAVTGDEDIVGQSCSKRESLECRVEPESREVSPEVTIVEEEDRALETKEMIAEERREDRETADVETVAEQDEMVALSEAEDIEDRKEKGDATVMETAREGVQEGGGETEQESETGRDGLEVGKVEESPASSEQWQDHLSAERTFGDGSPEAGSPSAECVIQSEDGETPPQQERRRMELPIGAEDESLVIEVAPVSPMADGTRQHATESDPIVWVSAPSSEGVVSTTENGDARSLAMVKQRTTEMFGEPDFEGDWHAEARPVKDDEMADSEGVASPVSSTSPSNMSDETGLTLRQDIEVLEAQRAKAAREMRVCEAALKTMKRKLSHLRSDPSSNGKRRREGQ